jgi:hypothetical protein
MKSAMLSSFLAYFFVVPTYAATVTATVTTASVQGSLSGVDGTILVGAKITANYSAPLKSSTPPPAGSDCYRTYAS